MLHHDITANLNYNSTAKATVPISFDPKTAVSDLHIYITYFVLD